MQEKPKIVQHLPQISLNSRSVTISWSAESKSEFHYIWLRDNCRCELCGDPVIGRRLSRLSEIPLDIVPDKTEICAESFNIEWSDHHRSSYSLNWLKHYDYSSQVQRFRLQNTALWNETFRESPIELEFDALAEEKLFLRMLCTVRDHGICFIKNAPTEAGTLERLALRIGPLQESNFGRVQDLVIDNTKRSIANSFEALKPHSDEPYRASPPGILMFHCVETDRTGAGASTFLDGFEAAEVLRSEDPEAFDVLCNSAQPFRRYFEGDVDLIAEFPVISVDEFGSITGVRVNDRVAAPLRIPTDNVTVFYRGMKRFLELCEDPERTIQRILSPGDVVIFDNHRVLHGRTELTITGRRWLQWIQVEKGDFHSRIRITSDALGIPRDDNPFLRGAY